MSSIPTVPPGSAPADVGTIRVFFIVSLIVNAIATMAWLGSTVVGGIATCGLGCLLIVLPTASAVAIVLDAMAISKLNQPPSTAIADFLKLTAIVDIIAGTVTMSVVPLIMGILVLVYLQKPEVKAHFGSAAP